MRILITGASGFLGSALACFLQDRGHEVSVLLRATSSRNRLQCRNFNVGTWDEDGALQDFVRRTSPQAVLHTACAYGRQGEPAAMLVDANVRQGLRLIEALQSVSDVAGPMPTFLNAGTALPPDVSAYARSKHQFGDWGRWLGQQPSAGLRFIDVQLEHMYGPGDDKSKFTTQVIHSCYGQADRLELTAGAQRRDFIFIEDVLSGYLVLIEHAHKLSSGIQVPLGSGQAPTLRYFVELVHRLCRSETQLDFGARPYRTGEAMHCQADLGIMRSLGWTPAWSLEDGLRRTITAEFSLP